MTDFIHVDAAHNIIYDTRTKNRSPIAVFGLRDYHPRADGRRGFVRAQIAGAKIKELVEKLAEDSRLKKVV